MEKIKVGAVSYLNTKPLLYGFYGNEELMRRIELLTDYPANVARKLMSGEIHVGLVPVAIIPELVQWTVVSDYCIGATGEVASVCLFSDVPMEQVKTVLLDYQSKTSVNLAKVLLKHYWKKDVVFKDATEDFRDHIKGDTAGVVIGDRAFEQRLTSAYIYDLAEAWKDFTGLPFVFAAWVANRPLEDDFIKLFNQANSVGMTKLNEIAAAENYPAYDLHKYYTQNMSYVLDDAKKEAIELFHCFLKHEELSTPPLCD